jgi:hypothetical protein
MFLFLPRKRCLPSAHFSSLASLLLASRYFLFPGEARRGEAIRSSIKVLVNGGEKKKKEKKRKRDP